MPLRVLMVDDHIGFRTRARVMLEAEGFDVVAEAGTGLDALALAAMVLPDVALVDIQLPDINGFEVAADMRSAGTAGQIILISGRDSSDYGDRVAQSAADSFISKAELSGDRLRAALR
jgi:DNA-binding NarL/FixJ family response regulator